MILADIPDFFLASTDTVGFEVPRKAWRVRYVPLEGGQRELLVVRVAPAVTGKNYGLTYDPDELLLAPRHTAERLEEVGPRAIFVHVAAGISPDVTRRKTITANEITEIAWGEVYQTEQDATEKKVL